MGKKKAQISVEFLLILSVLLIAVGISIVVSNKSLINTSKLKEEGNARNAIDVIGSAANEVYAQGEGAKKRVYVNIPLNYDLSASSISGKTIRIVAGGSDFVSTLDFQVYGSLPRTTGGNWIWVISEGNRVRIGTSLILVNKQAINVIMPSNITANETFSVKNIYGSPINLTITQVWTTSDVTLGIVPVTFTNLNDNKEISVNLTFTAIYNASGTYVGKITINGSSGNISESVVIPVNVYVTKIQQDLSPPLTIVPSLWNVSLLQGQNATKSFTVCTSETTTLAYVNFSASGGVPGAWAGLLTQLSAMNPGECIQKNFDITVPANTTTTGYAGYITATGDIANAQDSIALQVDVGGNTSDKIGPIVHNISTSSVRMFYPDPIMIRAIGNDSTTGNNSIKYCEFKLDTGAWINMSAVDGLFDTSQEEAYYTIKNGTLGKHNATVRCADQVGNIGGSYNLSFRIIKDILFVTVNNGYSTREQYWVNWLAQANSSEGYLWKYDNYSRTAVAAASFDALNYAIMFAADDLWNDGWGSSAGTNIKNKINNNFTPSGGWLMMVDNAADEGGNDFGLGTEWDTDYQDWVKIKSSNYLTQGLSLGNKQGYVTNVTLQEMRSYSTTDEVTSGGSPEEVYLGYSSSKKIMFEMLDQPYYFNYITSNMTMRALDYAINASTIK